MDNKQLVARGMARFWRRMWEQEHHPSQIVRMWAWLCEAGSIPPAEA